MKTPFIQPFFSTKMSLKIALAVLFGLVVLSIFFDMTVLYYIFTTMFLCIVLFIVYSVLLTKGEQKDSWILLSLGVMSFLLADIVYYIYKFFFIRTYAEFEFLQIMFLLCTLCIFGANLSYLINRFIIDVKNEAFIIINDMISVLLMITIFSIVIFSDIEISEVYSNITLFSGFFNIILSFFIIFCVISMAYSNHTLKISKSMFYFMIASIIYACIRMFYSYNVLKEISYYNPYLIMLFDVAFFIFVIGAFEVLDGDDKYIRTRNLNTVIKWAWPICLVPLIFKDDKNINLLIPIMFVFVCHSLVSHYTKSNVLMKNLLAKESEKHDELEFKLSKQTNELILTNLKLKDIIDKDYLTGIGSRSLIMQKLQKWLKSLTYDTKIIVYYINLRRFKFINTSYGNEVGDKILRIIAKRLMGICSQSEALSRFSADEFIIAKKIACGNEEQYMKFAQLVIKTISQEIIIGTHHFTIESTIGIEIGTKWKFNDVKELIKNADKAMYFAKQNPGSSICVYNSKIDKMQRYHARLEILMQTAVAEHEFEVHYQPVFNLKNGHIVCAEALIRWKNKEFGFLEANKFLDIINSNEYVSKIYNFVIKNVAECIKELENIGFGLPISINLTNRQTGSLEFLGNIKNVIKLNKISPKNLKIEITENTWMNDINILNEIFKALKELEIGVYIDNFGAGYSSIGYIKKHEIDSIKISSELTANICNSEQDKQILNAIIALSKSMEIESIAKGIENEEMLNIVKELGCDKAQGYELSRAMPQDRLIELVKKTNTQI